MYIYKYHKNINLNKLENLYADNNWQVYLKDINKLNDAINNSLEVISAWDDGKLIGLIRVVGDGYSIIYIQDILVLTSYQRQGIGTVLIKMILDKYSTVSQKVLITDDTEKNNLFYSSLGFEKSHDMNIIAYVRYDN